MKPILSLVICILICGYSFGQEDDQIRKDWQKMHDSKSGLFEEYNNLKFGMFIHWGVYSKLGGVYKGV